MFKLGVVIPVGPGREENVRRALFYLFANPRIEAVMCVLDGSDVAGIAPPPADPPVYETWIKRHQPGDEQPRNVGVRQLLLSHPDLTHVWFLDSDILVDPGCASFYEAAADQVGYDSILVGPYDWMEPGRVKPQPELFNDPRWEMFRERNLERTIGELGVALGNFSGNLVWPIDAFVRVGGFHPELHHGRCEDGELGLRAASNGVPMTLVAEARGWHMAHPVNHQLVNERNARDVPLLNKWHPWVAERGLIVSTEDGARFDYRCSCGQVVNTLEMWAHEASHTQRSEPRRVQ